MTLDFAPIQGTDWLAQLNANFKTLANASLIELASSEETITGTATNKGTTPKGVADALASALAAFIKSGTHAVTAEEATATTLTIDSGKSTATTFVVQIYRSNVMVMTDTVVSMTAGVITVANGAATFVLAENDVIHWIAI